MKTKVESIDGSAEEYDGYYSAKGAELCGYCLYKNKNGELFKITELVSVGDSPISVYDDLRFIGRVSGFVKSFKDKNQLNIIEQRIFKKNYENYR